MENVTTNFAVMAPDGIDVENVIVLDPMQKDSFSQALKRELIQLKEGEDVSPGFKYDALTKTFFNVNDEEETEEEISFLKRIGQWFKGEAS